MMKIVCTFIVFGIFCLKSLTADETDTNLVSSAGPIQIAAPTNHSFHLQADQMRPILENENIKDRHIVVVSIAGAFREGKSFMSNFFLKYLYAQYKTHDVSDWIGEQSNTGLEGFKWRSGRKRETVGIWMWSEVFTHDFADGEKVAILLLDTQGIFDDQSSVRDCTTIFALSMMLSSVQCYNLKENIKEDNLQHLELFTEYGRLALEQTQQKPFQELLFIVRDWPFAHETGYGWHGQTIIDETLAGNEDQTPEMRQLRTRIQSSFENITAFLMPHPGMTVARSNNFTGDIKDIDSEFVNYVKELVPGLFAPENLLAKRINGQKVRARDLLRYLEAYINIFNGDTIPEPKAVLMATAEAGILIMHKDSLDFYVDSIHKSIIEVEFLKDAELENIHQKTKNEAVERFKSKPKLGGDQLATKFQHKIESDIDEKYGSFKQTNEEKRKNFIERADLQNTKLNGEVKASFEQKILAKLDEMSTAIINYPELSGFISAELQASIQEFDSKKMGDDEISKLSRDETEQGLNDINSALANASESYHKYLNLYTESMKTSLDAKTTFFEQAELIQLHQNTKNGFLRRFGEEAKVCGAQIEIILQRNIDHQIEQKYIEIGQQNEQKHQSFIATANAHNENLIQELRTNFENKMLTSLSGGYIEDAAFISLFMDSKIESLNNFGTRKMGEGDITSSFRERLERDLDALQASLQANNNTKKPLPPVREVHHHHHHSSGPDCIIM